MPRTRRTAEKNDYQQSTQLLLEQSGKVYQAETKNPTEVGQFDEIEAALVALVLADVGLRLVERCRHLGLSQIRLGSEITQQLREQFVAVRSDAHELDDIHCLMAIPKWDTVTG